MANLWWKVVSPRRPCSPWQGPHVSRSDSQRVAGGMSGAFKRGARGDGKACLLGRKPAAESTLRPGGRRVGWPLTWRVPEFYKKLFQCIRCAHAASGRLLMCGRYNAWLVLSFAFLICRREVLMTNEQEPSKSSYKEMVESQLKKDRDEQAAKREAWFQKHPGGLPGGRRRSKKEVMLQYRSGESGHVRQ